MTFTLDVGKHIVAGTVLILGLLADRTPLCLSLRKSLRDFTVKPCMETTHVFRELFHFHIIYVIIKSTYSHVGLILYLNAGTLRKRHRKIATESRSSVRT